MKRTMLIYSAKTGKTKIIERELSQQEIDALEEEQKRCEDDFLKGEFFRQRKAEIAAVQQAEFETWKAEKKGK